MKELTRAVESLISRDDLPMLVIFSVAVIIALGFIAMMYVPSLSGQSGKIKPRRTTRSDHWKPRSVDSAEYD